MILEPAYNKQKGISLVFVLTLVASTLVVVLSMSIFLKNANENFHRKLGATRLEYITNKLYAIMQNDQAWEVTQRLNSDMDCISYGACDNIARTFSLYDPTGSILIDANRPQDGYTLNGTRCSEAGFVFDPNSKNLNCPFSIRLSWLPSQDPINPRKIQIRSQIRTNLIVNTERFEQTLFFTRGEFLETLDSNCAKLGGTLNQVTSVCELPFQGRSCLRGQKMIGVHAGTSLLECRDLPTVSTISCPGGASGMMPDGSLRCL